VSVLAVVLFLRVWHPRTRFLLMRERQTLGAVGPGAMAAHPGLSTERYAYTLGETIQAWIPWAILVGCVAVSGLNAAVFHDALPVPGRTNATTPVTLGSPLGITVEAASYTRLLFDLPGDRQIQRDRPVVNPCQPGQTSGCTGPERVQFTFNWLS